MQGPHAVHGYMQTRWEFKWEVQRLINMVHVKLVIFFMKKLH